jgi:hypothetical protein
LDEQQLGQFPFSPLRDLEAYQVFETELLRCIDGVEIGSGSEELQHVGRQIDPDFVRSALSSDMDLYRNVFATTEVDADLKDYVDSLQQQLKDVRSKQQQAYREAYAARLGYYTIEQEADELALEWMSRLGLNPNDALEVSLKLAQVAEEQRLGLDAAPLVTAYGRCRELMSRDWRDELGQVEWVAIGDFRDRHHDSCYTVFNLWRELRAHAYLSFSASDGYAFPGDWVEVMELSSHF